MVLLWIIMYLLPIFLIVAIWTKLYERLRCKVFITAIGAFCILAFVSLWNRQTELEKHEWVIDYVIERDNMYLECLDYSEDFDEMMDDCIIPFTKILRDTYK